MFVVWLHTDKQSMQTAKKGEHIPPNADEMLVVGCTWKEEELFSLEKEMLHRFHVV